jgi:hypothetical protein
LKGAYVLLLRVSKNFSKQVGSLGRVHFENGNYAYVLSPVFSLSKITKALCKEKEATALAYRLSDGIKKHQRKERNLFCRRDKSERVPIERDAVNAELF